MSKRRPVAEIVLIVIGAVLSCCWLPRGIMGLIYLIQAIGAKLRVSGDIAQLLQALSNPLAWYNQQIIQRFYIRGNFKVGQLLNAIPLCLYPLVGIAVLVVAIVLYARAKRAGGEETV
jgi:hypothetical protein